MHTVGHIREKAAIVSERPIGTQAIYLTDR